MNGKLSAAELADALTVIESANTGVHDQIRDHIDALQAENEALRAEMGRLTEGGVPR